MRVPLLSYVILSKESDRRRAAFDSAAFQASLTAFQASHEGVGRDGLFTGLLTGTGRDGLFTGLLTGTGGEAVEDRRGYAPFGLPSLKASRRRMRR